MFSSFRTIRFDSPMLGSRNFHSTRGSFGPLFDKILIANRGEIACRVIKTAKNMGIKTVAVYSTPDKRSKHVQMADEGYHLGGALSSESYLNQDKILEAIKKTGAQAVHPGYGFLSENAGFAKRLEENGIVFIGPTSFAIHAMGDKIESKKLATKAGVNVIPGKLADVNSVEEVIEIAKGIGYPVMIKASAGGGGKGMRIAWNDKEAEEGYHLAKQEAKASFGDDRLLIEKFIDNPRHIEIQLIADSHGNALYLNERECSIQRRNQKVLEEAPSSFIDPKTRAAMGAQAVQLAKAVQYRSAGTVEFLVDSKKNFYFLEMNTRLQVEHPVTEYITGLDLVEQMIKVAAGKKLEITQDQVQLKGHAMEARVYAEDPLRNFLPSIGHLESYKEPTSTDNSVRVDSGVREGDEISIYYDPLISKLVTYGSDRIGAINAMAKALDDYVIRGVNHNVCFLRSMMNHPRYISGNISTKFIPEEFPQGFHGHKLNEEEERQLVVAASIIKYNSLRKSSQIEGQLESYTAPEEIQFKVGANGKQFDVIVNGKEVKINGTSVPVKNPVFSSRNGEWSGHIGGKPVTLQLFKESTGSIRIQHVGTLFDVSVMTPEEAKLFPFMPVKKQIDTSKSLVTPMPGRVISINVKEGDKIGVGQPLAIVEAMKMQNVLRAEKDATIKSVLVKPGSDVAVDQQLILFE